MQGECVRISVCVAMGLMTRARWMCQNISMGCYGIDDTCKVNVSEYHSVSQWDYWHIHFACYRISVCVAMGLMTYTHCMCHNISMGCYGINDTITLHVSEYQSVLLWDWRHIHLACFRISVCVAMGLTHSPCMCQTISLCCYGIDDTFTLHVSEYQSVLLWDWWHIHHAHVRISVCVAMGLMSHGHCMCQTISLCCYGIDDTFTAHVSEYQSVLLWDWWHTHCMCQNISLCYYGIDDTFTLHMSEYQSVLLWNWCHMDIACVRISVCLAMAYAPCMCQNINLCCYGIDETFTLHITEYMSVCVAMGLMTHIHIHLACYRISVWVAMGLMTH